MIIDILMKNTELYWQEFTSTESKVSTRNKLSPTAEIALYEVIGLLCVTSPATNLDNK